MSEKIRSLSAEQPKVGPAPAPSSLPAEWEYVVCVRHSPLRPKTAAVKASSPSGARAAFIEECRAFMEDRHARTLKQEGVEPALRMNKAAELREQFDLAVKNADLYEWVIVTKEEADARKAALLAERNQRWGVGIPVLGTQPVA